MACVRKTIRCQPRHIAVSKNVSVSGCFIVVMVSKLAQTTTQINGRSGIYDRNASASLDDPTEEAGVDVPARDECDAPPARNPRQRCDRDRAGTFGHDPLVQ